MEQEVLSQIIDWIQDDESKNINEFKSKLLEHLESKKIHISNSEMAELLKSGLDSYDDEFNFQKGDLVMWKKGLKNRFLPGIGQPAIIFEILESSISIENESEYSPFYLEQLDIKIGVYDEEANTLVTIHVDGNRLKHWKND